MIVLQETHCHFANLVDRGSRPGRQPRRRLRSERRTGDGARCASRYTRRSRRAGADGGSPVTQTDKALLIIALILGVLDVLNIRGPLARFSAAGIAIVLLAVVELHRGGVFSY